MKALALHSQPSCHLVGGVVRDALDERVTPKDFDFVIGLEGASGLLDRLSEYGVVCQGPLGSPRWAPAGATETADIMIAERFWNGLDRCNTVEDVLRQFDFTANAVAIDLRTGQIVDPVGGLADAENRIIRAVRTDYPDSPVLEGAELTWSGMLWIRLWHFTAKLGWDVETVTWRWMTENRRYALQVDEFRARLFDPDLSQLDRFEVLGA